MTKLKLEVSFTTPAFLGNAKQQGQWRTPPFKTLLRQWWRVAVAKDCNYDVTTLREREAELFGSAAGEENVGQSKVRIRMEHWQNGSWSGKFSLKNNKIKHPEVKFPVGANLYLGYGPIGYQTGKGETVKMQPWIAPDETNKLQLDCPDDFKTIIQLAAWFGTLGSRSRNGWGSLLIQGEDIKDTGALLAGTPEILHKASRPLNECLHLDWPHALGRDDKGLLIWMSKDFIDWQQAMKYLAEKKIAFRTKLSVKTKLSVNGGFQNRHLLAYPVTHHTVNSWPNQARLANQLRFKVVKHHGNYSALAFHLPTALPQELAKNLGHLVPSEQQQCQVWQQVHRVLDGQMKRIGGAA